LTQDPAPPPLVLVVDDEAAVRDALDSLLRSVGFRVASYASPQEFLRSDLLQVANCLILDIRLPIVSGLDFQVQLAQSGIHVPVIFMTGHGDIPMSVRAMKAGAVDFLTKPVSQENLLAAIQRAIECDRVMRQTRAELQAIDERLNRLTPREREVFQHVVAGQLNKQIAVDLGTVEKTVKVHRSRVMEKMGVRSLADLVRIAERIGLATITAYSGSHPRPPNAPVR
jgi:FixJ family two-component response regulator